MPMRIDVAVGNAELEREIAASLRRMDCPSHESWSAALAAEESSWELLLEGAPRRAAVDWQVTPAGGGTRYRRMLHGANQRTKAFILRLVRELVWDAIHFRENPVRQQDQRLGEQFEEAVLDALRHESLPPVSVRFSVWNEGDVLQFVCKVEGQSLPAFDARELPWRWWSPLVRTPAELGAHLRAALRSRRPAEEKAPLTFGWEGDRPLPVAIGAQN